MASCQYLGSIESSLDTGTINKSSHDLSFAFSLSNDKETNYTKPYLSTLNIGSIPHITWNYSSTAYDKTEEYYR